jgi:hypothetical protein
MKREDDEQLWDLLGRQTGPDVSPFFARDVLRRIREQPSRLVQLRAWFSWRKLVPVSGLAVAVIAAAVFVHNPSVRQKPTTELDAVAKIDPQDYEVVVDLDDLLASDENNLWDDNSSL